tara:strand:+ start:27304 stop:28038 length:735 start_codon:yes stop_codon:yes gene_type:complete
MNTTYQTPSGVTASARPETSNIATIQLTNTKDQPRVDSRVIAEQLNIQHKNLLGIIDSYLDDFVELGTFAFKTRKSKGRPTRYALLNEDQSYLLLTYAKNTPLVRALKLNLVKAFKQSREGLAIQKDYLPFYHSMHESVKLLAKQASDNGSKTPEYVFHMTYNKLINNAFGLSSGSRKEITSQERVFISAAQAIAARGLEDGIKSGINHKELYQYIKAQIFDYAKSVRSLCFTDGSSQIMRSPS